MFGGSRTIRVGYVVHLKFLPQVTQIVALIQNLLCRYTDANGKRVAISPNSHRRIGDSSHRFLGENKVTNLSV